MLCISLTFKQDFDPYKTCQTCKTCSNHHLIDLLKTSLTLVCLCNMMPFISPLSANITIVSIKSPKLLLQRCGYIRGVARIFSEMHNSPIRFTLTPPPTHPQLSIFLRGHYVVYIFKVLGNKMKRFAFYLIVCLESLK